MINTNQKYTVHDKQGYIKNILNTSLEKNVGMFFLYGEADQDYFWQPPGLISKGCFAFTCRESLASYFCKTNSVLGFAYPALKPELLDEFLTYIENELKLSEKSQIYLTENWGNTAVIIKPSPFWLNFETTRQFFSLFVRCGGVFYSGDFEQAIKKYSLSRLIVPTIKHFLAGHTLPINDKQMNINDRGLVATYKEKTKSEIKDWLRLPETKLDAGAKV